MKEYKYNEKKVKNKLKTNKPHCAQMQRFAKKIKKKKQNK